MKKDICPKCRVSLFFNVTSGKFTCPRCGFVDRRHGNSTMDPSKDRREKPLDPWDNLKSYR